MQWYKNTLEETYNQLETTKDGLTNNNAQARLKHYGTNSIRVKKEPLWKIIVEPFRNAFVLVLGFAAAVSWMTGENLDGTIILIIISINAVIFYTQHYATNRVLRSLKKHSVQNVRVLRDSKTITTSSLYIVPGDIILLNEGERVPADARVIELDNLQVDESALTGESLPVHKKISTLEDDRPIYEWHNMVLQGTYVVSGKATAIVVDTGASTEFGRIAELATEKQTKSPVQQKIDGLVATFIKLIGGLVVIVFALSQIRGIETVESLRFVLAMAVSAVPEGLPVALSVIIVLGMRRMARKKVLVRTFKAIEDVGLITTIATDKTGTLTKNKLSVIDSYTATSTDLKTALGKTIDLSDDSTDALDGALKTYVGSTKVTKQNKFYPFDISLRMSGAFYKDDKHLYIKGSPEHVIAHCKLTAKQRELAESAMHSFASKGFKVIAVARHQVATQPKSLKNVPKGQHELLGLVALADELRADSASAIVKVQAAGIDVKMITGDHYETAYHIGREVGLATKPSQIITGAELPEHGQALAVAVKNASVFSRILPEDKFKILQALKVTEVTAMTGDGVNDVPALTNAHVGIAMGSGSDIAKDAANMVLINNKFSSIVAALSEGRKIYDNIRRMIFYLLSTSLGEVFTMVGALVFALPLPVTAIQILWINLVTDTALDLPLGLEPAEDGHMQRPPRRPKDPLLSRVMLLRTALVAATMAIVTLIVVNVLENRNYGVDYIQTVAFTVLIVAQWANAFNARSENESVFSRIKKPNYAMAVGLSVAIILQALVMFGPLGGVFNIVPVDIGILVTSSLAMILPIIIIVELHKLYIRKTT